MESGAMEISELWLPANFDLEIFVSEFLAWIPEGKVLGVIREVPHSEQKGPNTRVEYWVPLEDKVRLTLFLKNFAFEHNLCNSLWLGSLEWYNPSDGKIH